MSFTNTAPFEVIAAPYRVYVAPVGTAFPAVTVDESAIPTEWVLVGRSGDLNYDRGVGVVVSHTQTMAPWRSVGDAGVRKTFRTEEDLKISLKLVDLRLEQYQNAMNANTITPSGSTKKMGLSRGFAVSTFAVLIRSDVSPYGDGLNMQYEIPVAAQTGNPTINLSKPGEPAGLDLEWTALVDPDAASEDERFGRVVAETT
jgi:hypothetical protein